MEETVKRQFEQIFVKHYERLTGTRQSVGGLPFTTENMVCFILFGGRELDIEDIYGDVSERYSMETFIADARDAGIETDDHVQKAIDDLVAQKFLHIQPDGKFYSYQATRESARMLNRIYPKMQGLSLLAYIGQTMQEVESGRIDLPSALSRFDQTLQHHGIALPKPKIPVIAPAAKPAQAKKAEEPKPGSTKIIRDYVVTGPVKGKTERTAPQQATPPPAARETALPEARIDTAPPPIQREPEIEKAPPVEVGATLPVPEEKPAAKDIPEEEASDDDAIAAKIAAFEKELALTCPICKTHILKEEKTAGGKFFYSCTSEKCNFISWGKPHHTQCARCKNPFMVEVTDGEGQVFLKCPRATCQHRLPLSAAGSPSAGGVKKVIRKRLVRRKV